MSVRFYKRLFLGFLLVIFLVPVILAIVFGSTRGAALRDKRTLAEQVDLLETQVKQAGQDIQTLLERAETAEDMLGGVSVGVEPLEYQTLYPELYCDAPPAADRLRAENMVYLTFDDGPSSQTDDILDILAEHEVKATFFVNGHSGDNANARLRRILEEGHALGLHSETHDYQKIYASVENYLEDFNALYQRVYEATGYKAQVFRFPGGSVNVYNASIYQEIIAEMTRRGFTYYDWNASGQDAVNGISSGEVYWNVLSSLEGKQRAIVLLHDAGGGDATLRALGDIITGIRSWGYNFAALTPEIMPVTFGYRDIPEIS